MRYRASVAAVAASFIAFAAADAQALSLRLTDLSGGAGSKTVVDNGAEDMALQMGDITFVGSFGDFSFNVATGVSEAYPPFARLFANFIASSSGAGSIKLEITDSDFVLPTGVGLYDFAVDLTSNTAIGANVEITSYADASNTEFGTGTLLATLTGGVNALSDTSALTFGSPFSLTQVIKITNGAMGGTSDGDADTTVAPVPLPAAAWMLAAAVGGLGALSRKRRGA